MAYLDRHKHKRLKQVPKFLESQFCCGQTVWWLEEESKLFCRGQIVKIEGTVTEDDSEIKYQVEKRNKDGEVAVVKTLLEEKLSDSLEECLKSYNLKKFEIECFFNAYSSINETIIAEDLKQAIEIAKEDHPECRSFREADHWQ